MNSADVKVLRMDNDSQNLLEATKNSFLKNKSEVFPCKPTKNRR